MESVFTPQEKRCQYGACKGKEKGMVREYPINRDLIEAVPLFPGSTFFFKRDSETGKILTRPIDRGIYLELYLICDGCIEKMEKQIPILQLAMLNFGESWKAHINLI